MSLEGHGGISQLRKKCYDAAAAIPKAGVEGVTAVAALGKADQIAAAAGAGLGSMRLRGVGRRGASIGVGYSVQGLGNPTAIISWRGPAQLVNNNTSAHEIDHKKRTKALMLPGGFAAHVEHPGTHGKHFFEAGEAATARQAGAVMQRAQHKALARHFQGG